MLFTNSALLACKKFRIYLFPFSVCTTESMSHARSATDDEDLARALEKMHIHSEESMEEGSDERLISH